MIDSKLYMAGLSYSRHDSSSNFLIKYCRFVICAGTLELLLQQVAATKLSYIRDDSNSNIALPSLNSGQSSYISRQVEWGRFQEDYVQHSGDMHTKGSCHGTVSNK